MENNDINGLVNSLANESLDPDTRNIVHSIARDQGINLPPTAGMGNVDKAKYYVGQALQSANSTAESIPVIGAIAKKVGAVGKQANEAVEKFQENVFGPGNYQNNKLGRLAGLLPQNALSTELMAAGPALNGAKAVGGAISDAVGSGIEGVSEALNSPDRTGLSKMINPLPGNPLNPAEDNLLQKSAGLNEALGGSLTAEPVDAGTAAQKAAISSSQQAHVLAGKPWEDLKELANRPDIPQVYPSNLANAVKELNIDANNLPPELKSGRVYGIISKLNERLNNPQSLTAEGGKGVLTPATEEANQEAQTSMQELLASRQELAQQAVKGNKAFAMGQPNAAGFANKNSFVYNKLRSAVEQDIQDAAGQVKDPEFLDQFNSTLDNAKNAWKTYKDAYSNKTVQQFLKTQPEDIGDFLSKNSNNLQKLRDIIGSKADVAAKQSVAQDMLDKISGSSDPLGAHSKYLENNNGMLDQLFSPSEKDAFQNYAGARDKMLSTVPANSPTIMEKLIQHGKSLLPFQTKAALNSLGALDSLRQ